MFYLYDGRTSEIYSMTVNVINRPPIFDAGATLADVRVGVNQRVSVPLPPYSDPDGQSPITLALTTAYSFITIEGGNTLVIQCPS